MSSFRGLDQAVSNFGFRLQYNRLFKPEYLPARVKYNQFFAFALIGIWYGYNKSSVSSPNNFFKTHDWFS